MINEYNEPMLGKGYIIGPTTIRFFNEYMNGGIPIKDINVEVPVDYVIKAIWRGDTIELGLSSITKGTQREDMYYTFFENYSLDLPFARKTEVSGGGYAWWAFDMDLILIGENSITNKISELIKKHNEEILRIRKLYVSENKNYFFKK
jgi:hypothetical protein